MSKVSLVPNNSVLRVKKQLWMDTTGSDQRCVVSVAQVNFRLFRVYF